MTQSFAHAARSLAGHAAQALGWKPHDFWQATPIELAVSLGENTAAHPTMSRSELNNLMEIDQNGC